jgi:hypothetical protein
MSEDPNASGNWYLDNSSHPNRKVSKADHYNRLAPTNRNLGTQTTEDTHMAGPKSSSMISADRIKSQDKAAASEANQAQSTSWTENRNAEGKDK